MATNQRESQLRAVEVEKGDRVEQAEPLIGERVVQLLLFYCLGQQIIVINWCTGILPSLCCDHYGYVVKEEVIEFVVD